MSYFLGTFLFLLLEAGFYVFVNWFFRPHERQCVPERAKQHTRARETVSTSMTSRDSPLRARPPRDLASLFVSFLVKGLG